MAHDDHLGRLTRYTAWANGVLYDALRDVPPATFSEPRPGRPTGMAGVLGHIYVVGLIWKAHLTGQEHGFKTRQLDAPLPLDELQRRQSDLDLWYVEFADAQSADSLARDIAFTFVDGGAGVMTVDDMLLHVVNHGTYHRGFVADMLYEMGSRPPVMDLPVHVRHLRAAP